MSTLPRFAFLTSAAALFALACPANVGANPVTVVHGRIVERAAPGAPIHAAILIRGASGFERDYVVRADGTFTALALPPGTYTFQAAQRSRDEIVYGRPISVYVHEGARYRVELPVPGETWQPHVYDEQTSSLYVIR